MKILITGASGFVGRNVKEYLEKNNKNYIIYTPSSTELNCVEESEVTAYLKKIRFDYVLHFAVYGNAVDKSKDGTKIFDFNMRIFLNFAKNKHLYGKLYYSGSGAEYDKRYDICSVKEETFGESIPTDIYGLMKYTIANIIQNSDNIYNFRLFGIYGKYEHYPSKFISNICCKALKNIPLTIRQNVYFDYLWVDDFCRMLEYFIHNKPLHHTYNMVSGVRVSLEEICQMVIKISGKNLPVFICKEGLGNEYTASNERYLKENKEFHLTPMKKAVEELYHWYEEHEENIDLYQLLYL